MKESLFLLSNGVDVYKGGILQFSPWFLTLLSPFSFIFDNYYLVRCLFIVVDLAVGALIHELATKHSSQKSLFGDAAALKCHFFNPLGFFTVFGLNCGLFLGLLQLLAFVAALRRNFLLAAVICGFLIHCDFYNFSLIAPISFASSSVTLRIKIAIKCFAAWIVFTVSSRFVLFWFWRVPSASTLAVLDSVLLSRMRQDSLRPNAGLMWYLFAQTFPVFRDLLKITWQMCLMAFWPACAIKFRSDPLFMFSALTASLSILKGYPSVSDYALFFNLLLLHNWLFPRTRLLLISLFAAAAVFVIKMQVWRYWIEFPGFNANFYYIFTLIWNGLLVVIFLDLAAAYNKHKIYQQNPKLLEKEYDHFKLLQR